MLTNLRDNRRALPRIKPPPSKQPLFATPHLWKLITHPMRWHPIFSHHAQSDPARFSPPPGLRARLIQGALVALWVAALIAFPQFVFIMTIVLMGAFPVLLVLFNGTVLGTLWAIDISSGIATEHTRGRYPLLSLTPRGALGVSWLIGTARLHKRNWLKASHGMIRGLAIIIVPTSIFIIIIVSGSLILRPDDPATAQGLKRAMIHTLAPLSALMVILWLDNIQSALLACLPGLLIPSYLTERTQVRLLTGATFISLQVASYAAVLIMALLLEVILSALIADYTVQLLVLSAGAVLFFYLVREAFIGLLWRQLLRRFHVNAAEFYTLARI